MVLLVLVSVTIYCCCKKGGSEGEEVVDQNPEYGRMGQSGDYVGTEAVDGNEGYGGGEYEEEGETYARDGNEDYSMDE